MKQLNEYVREQIIAWIPTIMKQYELLSVHFCKVAYTVITCLGVLSARTFDSNISQLLRISKYYTKPPDYKTSYYPVSTFIIEIYCVENNVLPAYK